jgi:hypothetical protein
MSDDPKPNEDDIATSDPKRVFTVEYLTYDEQEAENVYLWLEMLMAQTGASGVLSQSSEEEDISDPLECPTLVITDKIEGAKPAANAAGAQVTRRLSIDEVEMFDRPLLASMETVDRGRLVAGAQDSALADKAADAWWITRNS